MPISRIYQNTPLATNSTIELDTQASHHIARVLRANIHDSLVIFNGTGGEYLGVITHIDKKKVNVQINTYSPRETESSLNLWLAQGISRGEKMDYTIQKAVELGVTKIIPLITERCNVRLDEERSQKRLQHWEKIIISATEQCGRNQIPEILPPQSLTHWLKNRVADYFFVLSPTATQKLSEMSIPKTARIALLIGPEGGLSDQEIDYLTQQQFIPISLGPRILRTETAAIAAITAFQCYFGDL